MKEDLESAIAQLGKVKGYAIKAQVHAGGRGLGYFKENSFKGGVHVVSTSTEVTDIVPKMLHKTLVTKQTGETGVKCNSLYIVEKVKVTNEKYLSITLDRKHQAPVIVGSAMGGVNIEDVSRDHPEQIKILPINVQTGLQRIEAIKYAESLGFKGDLVGQTADVIFYVKLDSVRLI